MQITITNKIVGIICDHLCMEPNDLPEYSTVSDLTAVGLQEHWYQCSRDLSHLKRNERLAVLQRDMPYKPLIVDGLEVTLFNDVQVAKGQPSTKAVVVDLGGKRLIVTGF